jgi:hypothetical protein
MASDQGGQNPEVWILDRSEITQDDHGAQLRAAAVRVWPKVETFERGSSAEARSLVRRA